MNFLKFRRLSLIKKIKLTKKVSKKYLLNITKTYSLKLSLYKPIIK